MKPPRQRRSFAPRLEVLEDRAVPSVAPPAELTDNNAAAWTTFAADGKSATVADDATKVMVGTRSLRFTTQSGADTGIKLRSGAQAWDLSTYKQLQFWTFSVNPNAAGFQGAQPVVILTSPTGSYRFTPRNQGPFPDNGWDKQHISLVGDAFWSRSVTGTPSLSNITGIEIHQHTNGAGFTINYDGLGFSKIDTAVQAPSGPTPSGVQAGSVSPRVLLYVFDPVMENKGGQRLHTAYGWGDPQQLARYAMLDLQDASNGLYRPQVTEMLIMDQHPYFTDGFQYTDQTYATAQANGSYHQGTFDYARFLRDTGLGARVDRGEIDEVWIYAAPGSGLSESAMAGADAYRLHGPTLTAGQRAFPIMGLRYDRGVGDALVAFGHRVEDTLAHVYVPLAADTNNAWKRFTRLDKDAPGQGGVGTVDTPVNGLRAGDYDNRRSVPSTADDWEKYPSLTGAKTAVTSNSWSPTHADPKRDYLDWWLDHLPDVPGRAADDRLNNWWRYIADLDTFKNNLDLHGSDGSGTVVLTGVQPNATVKGVLQLGATGVVDGVFGRVDLYVDGAFYTSDTLGPFTFRLDTSKMSGGKHTLQVRGYEAQRGSEVRSAVVSVNVVVPNQPPTLDAISAKYVVETNLLSFQAVAHDPDAGQKRTFSLGAGAQGGMAIDPNTGVFTWRPADGTSTSSYTVTVRVTDAGGLSATRTVQITVRDDPPTARFVVSGGQLAPGKPVTFSFLDATDLSAADRAAGYRYSFDWNNDGDFTDAGEMSDGAAASLSHAFASAGTYTVHGRIRDKDGGARDYTTTVTVKVTGGPGRVIDLAPGSASSSPTQLFAIGRTLYFVATTPTTGEELFRTNGTNGGTALVKDITPGSGGSLPRNLTNVNGVLFFTAQDSTHGVELWRSDGTDAGTYMVKDINPGTSSSWPTALTTINGVLYFRAYTPSNGVELWRSDGTDAGTHMVIDLVPGPGSGSPEQFIRFAGGFAFVGTRSDVGSELFLTDGTAAGTVLLKDVNPGRGSSYITGMVNAGGLLYFSAYTPTYGQELWKSDSSIAGTVMVKDISPGADSSSPLGLVALGSRVFFTASDPNIGTEPWVSDGTAAGTRLLGDIVPGVSSSAPSSLTVYNGQVYFAANQPNVGVELWKSDGTVAGTLLVADIQPGTTSSTPDSLVVSGGYLWFVGWTSAKGSELWRTNGTAAGTQSLSMLYPGVKPSWPSTPVDVAGTVFFVAYESGYGYELWTANKTG